MLAAAVAVASADASPPASTSASAVRHEARGTGWFQARVDFVAPVGGRAPAKGDVLTAAGAFAVGGRLHPRVGVYTGITTFAHIRKDMRVDSILGDDLPEPTAAPASFGQLTLFDLMVLRVFVPTKTWVEPYLDLGGSVGAYSKPYKKGHVVAGGGRIGAGVDFWIGPIFSVGLAFDQRFIAIERTLGHTLNAGVTTSVHW